MAKWNLIAPPTFLNELLGLPADVSRRVTQKVKVIERDPISAQGDAKKIGDHKPPIYRARIGSYRLFYSFGDGWVKLLCVRKRDDRTYADDLPDLAAPETAPPADLVATELPAAIPAGHIADEPGVSSVADEPLTPDDEADARLLAPEPVASSMEPRPLPVVISAELLRQWQIPEHHWPTLLQATTEDDLLVAGLPVTLFDRVCDILFPRSIAEIARQPEYMLPEPEDLDRYIEGELTAFLLKLDADQQRILDTALDGPAIDEAQDLSPVALRFLLASVASPQGIYLTADASQSLYQRGFSWKAIHGDLSVRGRSVLLRSNYRNTAEITAACAAILQGTGAGDDESVTQESAAHHGGAPTLLFARGGDGEATAIRDFFAAAARELRLPIHVDNPSPFVDGLDAPLWRRATPEVSS